MNRYAWIAAIAIALVGCLCVVVANILDRDYRYGSDGPHSAWTATWAGDVDGDGTQDILLSTRFEPRISGYGCARVLSGKTRKCLRVLPDPQWPEFVYWVPACASDVNGDGRDDLFNERDGRRVVIDVLSGRELMSFTNKDYDLCRPVGDIDHDGCGDLLVAGQPAAANPRRFVSLISGKSSHALWSTGGVNAGHGSSTRKFVEHGCEVGDINGDGMRDFAIDTASDRIRLLSGRDGSTLRDLDVAVEDSGGILKSAGDVDRDGSIELLVRRNYEHDIQVVRVNDAVTLLTIAHNVLDEPRNIGDYDGDGIPDIALCGWDSVSIYSGAGGNQIASVKDAWFSAGAADFDHDGRSDLLITRNVWGDAAAKLGDEVWRAGHVEVLSGRDQSVLFELDGADLEN